VFGESHAGEGRKYKFVIKNARGDNTVTFEVKVAK
jgi:hypothetical protein